ncbi:MAG: LysM peptidoglycan-binding domain-containing protein [Tepidiformaceae bacterium]
MNTQKQILLIVVLFFTLVGGCAAYSIIDLPYRAPNQATYQQAQSVERGALLFANNCRTCHGIKGEGGVGLPLNKPEFQDQDPLVLAANTALIHTTLYCGRAGTLMPAWLSTNGGSLNGEQIVHLIDLITAPVSDKFKDDAGNPTSEGWNEAVDFAHNLNRETNALVGGDSLDSVAASHDVGYEALAKANNMAVDAKLTPGMVIKMPGFKNMPNGYDYHVYNNNESITKIADSQHVGAIMLADLNNLNYKFTEAKDSSTFTLLSEQGAVITGLFPGITLKLPENSVYVVKSGDTLNDIADKNGVSASDIQSLNSDVLSGVAADAKIDSERKLILPPGTQVIVQPGQTVGVIATNHGVDLKALQDLNNLTAETVVGAGQSLKLPDNTKYTIQKGDTIASVAKAHGITADQLATTNKLKATDPISPDVVLKMPKIDKFKVEGQTLKDVAKGYSNVTADSLAKANDIVPADSNLRIGLKLNLPADAWGSAPPNTINQGTACVQHAVPQSTFDKLPGLSTATPAAAATPPATQAKNPSVEAHADDFTITADGTAQAPNLGVVLIAKGTTVPFVNKVGLHTIDLNGVQQGDNFKQGETRQITFNTTGEIKVTCSFHPDMLIDVFVQ